MCVIGFSAFCKGYLCLNKELGNVYMSRHMVFNEFHFPFSSIFFSSSSSPSPFDPSYYTFSTASLSPLLNTPFSSSISHSHLYYPLKLSTFSSPSISSSSFSPQQDTKHNASMCLPPLKLIPTIVYIINSP